MCTGVARPGDTCSPHQEGLLAPSLLLEQEEWVPQPSPKTPTSSLMGAGSRFLKTWLRRQEGLCVIQNVSREARIALPALQRKLRSCSLSPWRGLSRRVVLQEDHRESALWIHELSQLHTAQRAGAAVVSSPHYRQRSRVLEAVTQGYPVGPRRPELKGPPCGSSSASRQGPLRVSKTLHLPCPLTTILCSPERNYNLALPRSEGPSLHGFPRRARGGCSLLGAFHVRHQRPSPPLPPS